MITKMSGIQLFRTNNAIEGFSMLQKGRLDFVITEEFSVTYHKKNNLIDPNFNSLNIKEEWQYIGLSKKAPHTKELIYLMTKQIEKMKQNGENETKWRNRKNC